MNPITPDGSLPNPSSIVIQLARQAIISPPTAKEPSNSPKGRINSPSVILKFFYRSPTPSNQATISTFPSIPLPSLKTIKSHTLSISPFQLPYDCNQSNPQAAKQSTPLTSIPTLLDKGAEAEEMTPNGS